MSRQTLAGRAGRGLGVRASAYVGEHYVTTAGGSVLVADRYETPPDIVRRLTRRYGQPRTIDRGEIAYWDVTDDMVNATEETDVCALGPSGESVVIASTNIMADRPYEDRCADAAHIVHLVNAVEDLRIVCLALNAAKEARDEAGYGNMTSKRHVAERVLRDAENAVVEAAYALAQIEEAASVWVVKR